MIDTLSKFSLPNIKEKLAVGDLPIKGITELGGAYYKITAPANFCGIAMHAGSKVRRSIEPFLALNKRERFREEDPHTELFIKNFPIQIVGLDSRFEYDINREPYRAIYEKMKAEWNMLVWHEELPENEKRISVKKHQEFHDLLDIIVEFMLTQNKHAVVFDVHSYNYQRDGKKDWFIDEKPVVNIGTRAVNRALFGTKIDILINELAKIKIDDHLISVKENDIFFGGYLSHRLSKEHFNNVLVLAIEFKKIFMDEKNGQIFQPAFNMLLNEFERAAKKIVTRV